MTVKEYNHEFLPRIQRAKEFVSLFESGIDHMDASRVDKDEVRRQFKIRCWSEETKQMILTALDYYKKHEGLAMIDYDNRIDFQRQKLVWLLSGKSIDTPSDVECVADWLLSNGVSVL